MRIWPGVSLFRPFQSPAAKNLAVKRFMARYISYLEICGFFLVGLVILAIALCFFFRVDDLITGDPVAIKPREESIKRKADTLVTRVFIQNHQQVHQGDPLVEVVEDPPSMSHYLIIHQMQSLLDEFAAPGQAAALAKRRLEQAQEEARKAALTGIKKVGPNLTETETSKKEEKPLPVVPLSPEEEKTRALVQKRLADWQAHGAPLSPRILIRSPINGIVVSPDDLEFKKVDADAEILKVVDLDDLRLDIKVAGDTIADARTGQKASIKAIFPDYKTGIIFRGDTIPQGNYPWQKERVTSYSLLDPKIKDIVKDAFKKRKITQHDDIPFDVTAVTDIEVISSLRTAPVEKEEKDLISGDPPAGLELTGTVVEGKHTVTVQVADMPPAIIHQITGMVVDKLHGKVIADPQQPIKEGGPAPMDYLRVESVGRASMIAKMKGENKNPRGPTSRLKREAHKAVQGGFLERNYEATVRIDNPPRFLKDRVLELLDQGKEVKAKVSVKTGQRPVALLLLKR